MKSPGKNNNVKHHSSSLSQLY